MGGTFLSSLAANPSRLLPEHPSPDSAWGNPAPKKNALRIFGASERLEAHYTPTPPIGFLRPHHLTASRRYHGIESSCSNGWAYSIRKEGQVLIVNDCPMANLNWLRVRLIDGGLTCALTRLPSAELSPRQFYPLREPPRCARNARITRGRSVEANQWVN